MVFIYRGLRGRSIKLITELYLVFVYRRADKSLARSTSRCILSDGEIISFDTSLIYRVIHKSVKQFKISQQIHYATDHGNSYADRERNSPSIF